jgi:hypothetical protein
MRDTPQLQNQTQPGVDHGLLTLINRCRPAARDKENGAGSARAVAVEIVV